MKSQENVYGSRKIATVVYFSTWTRLSVVLNPVTWC